jgi:hypothetical protein
VRFAGTSRNICELPLGHRIVIFSTRAALPNPKYNGKLTLNIGLRYELFFPIAEKFGRQSNYIPETATLVIPKGKSQPRRRFPVQSDNEPEPG